MPAACGPAYAGSTSCLWSTISHEDRDGAGWAGCGARAAGAGGGGGGGAGAGAAGAAGWAVAAAGLGGDEICVAAASWPGLEPQAGEPACVVPGWEDQPWLVDCGAHVGTLEGCSPASAAGTAPGAGTFGAQLGIGGLP